MTAFVKAQDKMDKALQSLRLLHDTKEFKCTSTCLLASAADDAAMRWPCSIGQLIKHGSCLNSDTQRSALDGMATDVKDTANGILE